MKLGNTQSDNGILDIAITRNMEERSVSLREQLSQENLKLEIGD